MSISNRLTGMPFLKAIRPLSGAMLLLGCCPVMAQDTAAEKLPDATKLALRGKSGDIVKVETTSKGLVQLHLEELGFEVSEEVSVKANYSLQCQGAGVGGTLKVETRRNPAKQVSLINGQTVTRTIPASAVLMVYRPNMTRVSTTRLGGSSGGPKSGTNLNLAVSSNLLEDSPFTSPNLPDRVLKPGDTWSANIPSSGSNPYLKGITVSVQGTLIGFEMFQGFPCAHVEYVISYKGFLPALMAQVKKHLPSGARAEVTGEVNGTEVDYYALDRGVPLDEVTKVTLTVSVGMSKQGNTINYGGSYQVEQHSAVNAYPAYAPSLVPAVSPDSSK